MVETSSIEQWREAVDAAASRNATVELRVGGVGDADDRGDLRIDRGRLLAVHEGGELLVERPGQAGTAFRFVPGGQALVTLSHRGQRWEGRCRVVEVVEHALNGRTRLPALRLSPPTEVRSGQRRRFFRVSVGGSDSLLRLTVDVERADGGDLPHDGPLEAMLLNFSAGGLGASVALDGKAMESLRTTRQFHCLLRVPGHPVPLDLPARLVHLEPLAPGRAYLGLEFVLDGDPVRQRVQDLLARVAAELQRRQLRRQRYA